MYVLPALIIDFASHSTLLPACMLKDTVEVLIPWKWQGGYGVIYTLRKER